MNKNKKTKTPWPTKDAMEQVYEKHLWGGIESDFYSGDGSHNTEIIAPYLSELTSFLKSFTPKLIVCDLGCGDFNIGKKLVSYTKKYIGIDIVDNLIKRNKETFKEDNLKFHCLDISKDALPLGNCAIIRQVFQHLSNDEVQKVLNKLKNYKYIILTEHLPNLKFTPNKDIISGQGIRIKKQSGVDILAAPFYFQIKEEKQLSTIILENNKGIIVTTLYTLF